MSLLKDQLRLMIPRLAKEANKLRDSEARSRWMKLRSIALSPKSISKACAAQGCSVDFFNKWGKRLVKMRRILALTSKSRKPYRSPRKTKTSIEKKVLRVRRVEPYLGPDRISDSVEKLYEITVPPSTVFAILRRAKMVGKKIAERLTKKHMKRYRRPWPGYLQMDFKYVPFLIEGKQYYQLSCVDHHSSWRLIRNYRNKNQLCVLTFLKELRGVCPFYIVEIQTDNDAAFTDKFTSGMGVTGNHVMDQWCRENNITHRLIPVGVKELNGKVENTHKQDDREFFAIGFYKTYEAIELNTRGYCDRWNSQRATRALGRKTPNEVIKEAYVRAYVYLSLVLRKPSPTLYQLDKQGNAYLPLKEKKHRNQIKTRKLSRLDQYFKYLEWADAKKKLPALFTYPTMSLTSSRTLSGKPDLDRLQLEFLRVNLDQGRANEEEVHGRTDCQNP
jgi:transposase InsO family protein